MTWSISKPGEEEQERQEKSPHFAQCGRMVAEGVVAGRRVKIYEKGFVQVGMFSLGDPEKLLGITAQDQSQQKTALGRTLAALTMSPPTNSDLKAMHKLEAAGRSVLDALEAQNQAQTEKPATQPGTTASLADQLAQLSQLHQSGALTEDEFSAAKAHLLAGGEN